MNIYEYDSNGLARATERCEWWLVDKDGNQVSDRYSYIQASGEGYYRVERGAKENMMRPDGTLVLKEWHNDVFDVKNGYFQFGNTIRKTKDTPTRYIRGIAHVNGDIIFPMIFESVRTYDRVAYAELDNKPYYLFYDGYVYDFALSHLPNKLSVDYEKMLLRYKSFTIPAMDMYYKKNGVPTDIGGDVAFFNDKNIRRLGGLKDFLVVEDNFPYKGVKGKVCEGCMYAEQITGNGEGCGIFDKNEFREHYLKGECDHHKKDANTLSWFEKTEERRLKKERDIAEKQSDIFALRMVREFVDEILGGDIRNIKEIDIEDIRCDEKFFKSKVCDSDLIRSMMVLAFSDVWPELTFYNIEKSKYTCNLINNIVRLLGGNIGNEYLLGLNRFSPPEALAKKAMRTAKLTISIGDFIVWPGYNWQFDKYKDGLKTHGYFDRFLMSMYNGMCETGKTDVEMRRALKDPMMAGLQGKDGFDKFIKNMMLEEYVDQDGKPKEVFQYVWSFMKGLDTETYFSAVNQFCDFCDGFILRRADRIIEKIEKRLKEEK